MILANISNGLVYEHDDVCHFQSNYGHSAKKGYFRIDSMPYSAVIHLLKGGTITIRDATANNKGLTDGLKYGVPTWCIVFNRAINGKGSRHIKVCDWQTPEMKRAALDAKHRPLVQSIRKLIKLYGFRYHAIIGRNVILECERRINFDDKPKRIKELICQS